jgi:hypothetical protein
MTETALQAEAAGPTADVEFKGESFTIPLEYADYPLSFIEAASDGRAVAVQLRELFGPEQWATVQGMRLKGRDLDALSEKVEAVMGNSGNSPASSD